MTAVANAFTDDIVARAMSGDTVAIDTLLMSRKPTIVDMRDAIAGMQAVSKGPFRKL